MPTFPHMRLRRLRGDPKLRQMMRETHVSVDDLICPLFIRQGANIKNPIASMPGQFQWSVDTLVDEIQSIVDLNIPAVLLFGIPDHKDPEGSRAWAEDGVVQQAIRQIKTIAPDLYVIADVCCCEYTDHGHCGAIGENQDVDNDATLALLSKQSISLAQAGADLLAPSGMIDGMVASIRQSLDENHFQQIPILSYAVKYASALYGPFREAAEGAPQFGDRRTYQMDPANGAEALREAAMDVEEGADLLMVKPASAYLDVIFRVKQAHPEIPLAAYHVSGEYSMLKAACENGWLQEQAAVMEVITSIKRAGADIIITYHAKEIARWLQAQ